jgi:type II secretory pathway pseudopilin PulG
VATVVALVIVGTSFPASALLSQHHQLASADAQLARVQHQNALLAEQEQQLNNKTEIQRLARQEYQLVLPGQSLFNVLPADGQPVATGGGTSSLGDPGSQPLVSPSNAPDMTPDPGNPTSDATGTSTGTSPTTTTTPTSSGASVGGFWHRVSTTLEFWK